MIRLLFLVFIVLGFVSFGFSQTPDEETIERIKGDFKQVNIVAHIEIEKVEIYSEWKTQSDSAGYTFYRLTGKIVESFKGKFKKGEPIVFHTFIEGQPPPESLKRNYIRFLKNSRNEKGEKALLELENSGAAADQKNLSLLRKMRK